MKVSVLKRLIPTLLALMVVVALSSVAIATEADPDSIICKQCYDAGLTTGDLHATTEYMKISETQHAQYYECDNGHKQLRYDKEDGSFRDVFDHVASENATCEKAAVCGDCKQSFGAPLDHTPVVDPEVPATCTRTGLTAGSHCGVCGAVIVKQEVVEKTAHDFDEGKEVAPTCTKQGGVLYTCKNCKATLLTDVVDPIAHWYDEWEPVGNNKMSAPCKRAGCDYVKTTECIDWTFKLLDEDTDESTEYAVCPVCGETSDGTRLEMVKDATVWTLTGWTPQGELTIRVGDLENGEKIMSLAFEFDARLVQHIGNAEYTIPAEILEGYKLMLLDEDGNETELEVTVKGKKATFAVDFTAPWQERTPVRVMHLVPVEA